MSMSRLSDGPPDSGTKKLEETQTRLTELLQHNIEEGIVEYVETRNGIAVYRTLKPVQI